MLHPELQPPRIRKAALGPVDELDPIQLFNITWRRADGGIQHVCLASELTGVAANIVVMEGRRFPSGSHKVGPAYATLMEGELSGEIEPGKHTIIGPSTGNFGIGTASSADEADLLDVRSREEKERLFRYKELVWSGFGYSHSYLAEMQSPSFREAQFESISRIDQDQRTLRRP